MRRINAEADADPYCLRVSIDTKATVHVGDYSRGGRSRGTEALKALDHDMCMKQKLIPGGLLEPLTGHSFLFFGTHNKTSDFMADGLRMWWQQRAPELPTIRQLVINLDNGPECNGRRSQFLMRIGEFADLTGLCVRLIYYPPYHSKYNAIERYWAGLERAWNGYLLSTVETILKRAGNFCWKGMRTITRLLDTAYEKGVKLCGVKKQDLERRLQRSSDLPWWDITIHPKKVL